MNAVLWRANLTSSKLAKRILVVWLVAITSFILVSPWFLSYALIKMMVLVACWYEAYRAFSGIECRKGWLQMTRQEAWLWQGHEWRLTRQLGWCQWGVLIIWQSGKQQGCFWLMRDAMNEQQWRQLRFYWLSARNRPWR